MSDLEERVKVLEEKVKILEETLETVRNMNLSEQMESYIQKKSHALRMVELLNSVSDKPELDLSKEEEKVKTIQAKKNDLDIQIAKAIEESQVFSENYTNDFQYFEYEIETGIENHENVKELTEYLEEHYKEKGIRITGYNGFDAERIVVPYTIEGKPVISIGEKAFMNASLSEIILPESLIAILSESFEGCKNLKNMILPNGIRYLGQNCFSFSGLSEISIPESISKIPSKCFYMCYNLSKVRFCSNINVIAYGAFLHCQTLHHVILPDKTETINSKSFEDTTIDTIIIPASVQNVCSDSFSYKTTKMVFLGKETIIVGKRDNNMKSTVIYCLPGSKVQKYAREHNIPMKPLCEFNMEDYDV